LPVAAGLILPNPYAHSVSTPETPPNPAIQAGVAEIEFVFSNRPTRRNQTCLSEMSSFVRFQSSRAATVLYHRKQIAEACITISLFLRAPRRSCAAASWMPKQCGAGWQPAADWQSACRDPPVISQADGCGFAACRYAGQVGAARPIVNRPLRPATRQFLPQGTVPQGVRDIEVQGALIGAATIGSGYLSQL
jgi:hypothetical protein